MLAKLEILGFPGVRSLISERYEIFIQFYSIQKAIDERHFDIQSLIPDMVESVRYIGEHHIANMKNLLRRGHYIQDWDVGAEFKRSHMKSAPELEILSAAITIQNCLLDVFSLFYELQNNESPSSIQGKFQKQIEYFL